MTISLQSTLEKMPILLKLFRTFSVVQEQTFQLALFALKRLGDANQDVQKEREKLAKLMVQTKELEEAAYKLGAKDKGSKTGKSGAAGKLANDPKNAEMKHVKKRWTDWKKNNPRQYSGNAEFARKMVEEYELDSHKNIERNCTIWAREAKLGSR